MVAGTIHRGTAHTNHNQLNVYETALRPVRAVRDVPRLDFMQGKESQ